MINETISKKETVKLISFKEFIIKSIETKHYANKLSKKYVTKINLIII